jgi:putative transposase
MPVARRRPKPGLIHHPDQRSQYVSVAFGQAARGGGIARSMGSKGDCYDSAVAESFFATLKKELVHRRSWPTRHELTRKLFEYIRGVLQPHPRAPTLGMLSPLDHENNTLTQPDAGLAASRLAPTHTEIINT